MKERRTFKRKKGLLQGKRFDCDIIKNACSIRELPGSGRPWVALYGSERRRVVGGDAGIRVGRGHLHMIKVKVTRGSIPGCEWVIIEEMREGVILGEMRVGERQTTTNKARLLAKCQLLAL